MTIFAVTRRACVVGVSVLVVAASTGSFAADVTLTQWQTNLRPPDIEGIEKLVKRFEETHPGIRIQIEATPWATHNQKVLAAHTAGSGLPDVGRIGDLGQAANIGFVRPLDDFIDAEWQERIVETAWADATFPLEGQDEAHIWGVPKMLATEVWFYNKTMFEAAGLDPEQPPQTVEEFTEMASQLTRDTTGDGRIDQWGVSLTAGAEGGPWRQYLMAAKSFGGQLVPGRYADSKPGDPITWDSPETVAGFAWLVDLYREGYSPPSTISDTVRDVANNFRAGRVAMTFMGPWEMAATREVFEENGWEWGLFRFPEGPGGRGEFMYIGALGLFAQSNHVEEAVEYLRFYTSAEGLSLYMQTNGMIPAIREALADPYYSEDPYYQVFLDTIESADLHSPKWMSLRGSSAHFDSVWTPLYQQMLAGDVAVADAVRQMQASLSDYLGE